MQLVEILMEPLMLTTSALLAASGGLAAWTLLKALGRPAPLPPNASSFELERRATLETDATYRWVQPLVHELAGWNRRVLHRDRCEAIRNNMTIAATPQQWEPEEFVATKQLEGVLAGAVVGAILFPFTSSLIAVVSILAIAAVYPRMAAASLREQAKSRLRAIKMRLPFVIDLLALMLEAGSTFNDALRTVVRENLNHPLGSELARVERQVLAGRPRCEALSSLYERLGDEDIREIVFAVNKGEELGTPLADILRNQADQLRLKRSQWCEKAAAEAQVKMSFPGLLVMGACILIIMAPIFMPLLGMLRN